MKVLLTLLTSLGVMSLFVSSAKAAEQNSVLNCSEEQKLVDRVWTNFVWGVRVTSDRELAAGIRLNSLFVVLPRCLAIDPKTIINGKADKLSSSDLAILQNYEPSNPASGYVRCLLKTQRSEVLSFLSRADRSIAQLSLKQEVTKSPSLQPSFEAVLKVSGKCVDLVTKPDGGIFYNINDVYADLNWYARVKPSLGVIATWNEGLE